MQNIGERLEEARKRKGISIREAAEATKIRGDYLQKFEANSFELDLPPLYIRGFVRSYARYLDLDTDKILQDFGAATAPHSKSAKRETREVYGRVDFNESSERSDEPAEESAPPERSERNQVQQALLLKYGVLGGGALVVVLIIILLINLLSSKSGSPGSRSSAGQATTTAQSDTLQLVTFTALDNTRVKVIQAGDGAVLISDHNPMIRNETRTIRKVGRLEIVVEDRKKVRVEVNGRQFDIPRLQGQGGDFGRFYLD